MTGALEIALACDMIVASERARFADTHAKVGLIPGWGMSAALPTAVGRRKAVELSLTGAFIDADEALRIGLVNAVVPHEELLPRTYEIAQAIGGIAHVRACQTIDRDRVSDRILRLRCSRSTLRMRGVCHKHL